MSNTAILERSRAPATSAPVRDVVFRTAGRRHGSIVRLASPSDVGELIKPFVFLDHAEAKYTGRPPVRHSPALGHCHTDGGAAGRVLPMRTPREKSGQVTERRSRMDGKPATASGTTVVRSKAHRCAFSSCGWPCRPRKKTRRLRANTFRQRPWSRMARCAWCWANMAAHAARSARRKASTICTFV